jgi:hypothetical protein
VAERNSPTASAFQPNVRKDGLEIVFASNRRMGTDQDRVSWWSCSARPKAIHSSRRRRSVAAEQEASAMRR